MAECHGSPCLAPRRRSETTKHRIWAISRDLTRYQPLVRLFGWTMVIAGPTYLLIDLQCPLPLWWTLMDSVGCFLIGIILLWACPPGDKRPSSKD